MKAWSKYNTLFRSEKYGRFLYNALSGLMLEVDEFYYRMLQGIQKGAASDLLEIDREFIDWLEKKRFLVDSSYEEQELMKMKHQRNAACLDSSYLNLTVCPTLGCNFSCYYCFEKSQDDFTVMSEKTMNALISFIENHHDSKKLSVTWYGGEPLLAFDVIKKLTDKFLEYDSEYDNAVLISNAFLLDERIIEQLDVLKINRIQIVLDGKEFTHNRRRMLKDGSPTYRVIVQNLDTLMSSGWGGRCTVRINIDKMNQEEYAECCLELLSRYKGMNLRVYPGRVKTFFYDAKGIDYKNLSDKEWADFMVDGYHKSGVLPLEGFYPRRRISNNCIATNFFGYVIGPKGEIYKCWEDVGRDDMIVGSLHKDGVLSNLKLLEDYIFETDPYNDRKCMNCTVFPICGGGCVNKRLRNWKFKERDVKYCSSFKKSLITYLEAHLDTLETINICNALLGKEYANCSKMGYRIVSKNKVESLVGRNNNKKTFRHPERSVL